MHIGRLQQQATDAETKVSQLQMRLDEMTSDVEGRTTNAVELERQRLQLEFDDRIEAATLQRKLHANSTRLCSVA